MADESSVAPPDNPVAPRAGGIGAVALLKDVEVAGEPIDIYVNGQLLGRGEAVVVGDRYGVRITELLSPEGNP